MKNYIAQSWEIEDSTKSNFVAESCCPIFQDKTLTKKNAINLYNEIRLPLSLDYKTPNRVYQLSA